MRSSMSTMIFPHPFCLSGYPGELPAGAYDVTTEEEVLRGPGFIAYRKTATFLAVAGTGRRVGRTELRRITEADLVVALAPSRKCIR